MPTSTENAATGEYLNLLKASAERLERTVSAMKEMLTLKLPDWTKQTLTRNIQEGEALISQLREIS